MDSVLKPDKGRAALMARVEEIYTLISANGWPLVDQKQLQMQASLCCN